MDLFQLLSSFSLFHTIETSAELCFLPGRRAFKKMPFFEPWLIFSFSVLHCTNGRKVSCQRKQQNSLHTKPLFEVPLAVMPHGCIPILCILRGIHQLGGVKSVLGVLYQLLLGLLDIVGARRSDRWMLNMGSVFCSSPFEG